MSKLTALLEADEGRRGSAYQDSLGYWTIGVGRLIDERKGGRLTDDEIDYLLANDIREKTAMVRAQWPWFDHLNDARQAVLICMAFQLGIGGLLNFKKALGAMRDERWPDAAREMKDSTWAKQTPARCSRLAYQMETGAWQT
jgi:lysozyme